MNIRPIALTVFCVAAAGLISGCTREGRLTTSSPAALRAYEEGIVLYEKFYYREALAEIDSAIAADSLFAMAWLRRGVLRAELRSMDVARKDVEKALSLSGPTTPSEQLSIRMWLAMLTFRPNDAARLADSLIACSPYVREAYLLRGRLYEQEKKNEEAIEMYRRALAQDSTYAQAVMSLGYAYSNLGEVDLASEMMERYIRLRPHDADPPASYGDVLLRTGRFDEALVQYMASLAIKPDYWYSYQRIGEIYAILGRLKAAEEQFNRSLDFLPPGEQSEVSHLLFAARLDMLRARYNEAAGRFRLALQADTTSGDAAYGLTSAFAKLGMREDADRLIEAIHRELKRRNLLTSPAMASYHLMRAIALTERGEYEGALGAAQEALGASLPTMRLRIYNQIAEIHLRTGNLESAFDALEQALSIAPNMPDVLLTLAKVYQKKGDRLMTQKLGQMLWKTWSEADADFYRLAELRRLAPAPRIATRINR